MAISKKQRRQAHILNELVKHPTIRVSELAETLQVSTETLRRDLAELDEAGRINRTYGGATRSYFSEPQLADRMQLRLTERQAIARKALELVEGCDAVFIGGGATTLHFARLLRHAGRPVSVITPAYGIARELSENRHLQIMCLPGLFNGAEGLVTGGETLAAIRRYRAPVAIMGASGIDEDGVSEALLSASEIYAAIIDSSEEIFVLADQSKFNRRSIKLIGEWGENTHLVTDTRPDAALASKIEQAGTAIHVSLDEGGSRFRV